MRLSAGTEGISRKARDRCWRTWLWRMLAFTTAQLTILKTAGCRQPPYIFKLVHDPYIQEAFLMDSYMVHGRGSENLPSNSFTYRLNGFRYVVFNISWSVLGHVFEHWLGLWVVPRPTACGLFLLPEKHSQFSRSLHTFERGRTLQYSNLELS